MTCEYKIKKDFTNKITELEKTLNDNTKWLTNSLTAKKKTSKFGRFFIWIFTCGKGFNHVKVNDVAESLFELCQKNKQFLTKKLSGRIKKILDELNKKTHQKYKDIVLKKKNKHRSFNSTQTKRKNQKRQRNLLKKTKNDPKEPENTETKPIKNDLPKNEDNDIRFAEFNLKEAFKHPEPLNLADIQRAPNQNQLTTQVFNAINTIKSGLNSENDNQLQTTLAVLANLIFDLSSYKENIPANIPFIKDVLLEILIEAEKKRKPKRMGYNLDRINQRNPPKFISRIQIYVRSS